jgi:hypothetical protein
MTSFIFCGRGEREREKDRERERERRVGRKWAEKRR